MPSHPPEGPTLQRGDFPFPLTHRSSESPLLTWLRNHSNYMAVRGVLDYVRIAAILIRGVVINSIVTLPFLLFIAIVIGLLYGTLLWNWDEQLAPSEERQKAQYDLDLAMEGREKSREKIAKLRQTYIDERNRVEQRRQSAKIRFFLTNLDTTKSPIQEGDFRDLASLVAKLVPPAEPAPTDPRRRIDRFVWSQLGNDTRQAIQNFHRDKQGQDKDGRSYEEILRHPLYQDFNLLLHDPFLPNTRAKLDQDKIKLRPGTKLLLETYAGSRELKIGGFPNLPALAHKLKYPSNRPIDHWLAERLSPDTKKALWEYQGGSSDRKVLEKLLAEFFEGVIRNEDLDRDCSPAKIEFRPKTAFLQEQRQTGSDTDTITRLNRLIIEDAYPHELWWRAGIPDLASVNRLLLEDIYPQELKRKSGGWVRWMQDHLHFRPPFVLTPLALALAGVVVLAFPLFIVFARIMGHRRSLQTGTQSGAEGSVRRRDFIERGFGLLLLVVTGTALFELLPLVVHFYHQFRVTHLDGSLPWREYLAVAGTVYSLLAGAEKLTSALRGVWRKVVVFIIGALGLAAPFMVVVAATDFLVYADLPATLNYLWLLYLTLAVIPVVYSVLIAVTLVVGWSTRAFSPRDMLGTIKIGAQCVGWHLIIGTIIFFSIQVAESNPEAVPGILVSANPTKELYFFSIQADLSLYFVAVVAFELLFFCWLTVDVNLTSVHGLYRDRLATAYLLRLKGKKEAEIEDDVPLTDLCRHDARSTAPYHLVNVALNLQASKDLNVRDRKSDFFIFSKKFIGGERTGYCRTVTMEQVFPQVHLASAMAISAGAASPNMGRNTVPILVPLLTLINLRLGVWVPHPGVLAGEVRDRRRRWFQPPWQSPSRNGYGFDRVFREELVSIEKRWELLDDTPASRQRSQETDRPSPAHGLAGIGFSGGGIRSATLNLGIAQALHDAGVFVHFDYMSTVSGGGYLGSSISAFMRCRVSPNSEVAGKVEVQETDTAKIVIVIPDAAGQAVGEYRYHKKAGLGVKTGDRVAVGQPLIRRARQLRCSEIAGKVTVQDLENGATLVRIANDSTGESREYQFEDHERVCLRTGQSIKAGAPLTENLSSFANRFRWRVRARALRWEMTMNLDDTQRWVNVSDGGHIENLAAIELLRRRCKLVVVGDGEADPELHFNGLATLMRTALIDLGIKIEINVEALRLDEQRRSGRHFALGKITYPDESEPGYLLYLKSSVTGDEDEVIWEYRNRSPGFPHESTADQFFDEGQFEAYRALGQHIGETALTALVQARPEESPDLTQFPQLLKSFESLWLQQESPPPRTATAS